MPNAYDILDTYMDTAGEEYDVHPDLIKSVAASESSFDPTKVSPKGAVGIMQLMPLIAREYGVTDPLDPIQNIRAGTRYLGDLLKKHGGNQELALAEYHGGPKNVKTGKVPVWSSGYVRKTMQNFADTGNIRRLYSKAKLAPSETLPAEETRELVR
jgi:soluble lytic murein transglycosylase-like protein